MNLNLKLYKCISYFNNVKFNNIYINVIARYTYYVFYNALNIRT